MIKIKTINKQNETTTKPHWSVLEDENDWPNDQGSLKDVDIAEILKQ